MIGSNFHKLREDSSGSIVVEFALLAPLFLTLLIGVFHAGTYLQNHNAVRSVVSDAARFVTVEYQRGEGPTTPEIRAVILGRAVSVPYNLDTDRLNVEVTKLGTSRVAGATEFDINVEYVLSDWLPFVDLPGTTLRYSRPVFVVEPLPET